jgi:hypothetical protein
MAETSQSASHEMRAGARLHSNRARRRVCEQLNELSACYLPAKDLFALSVLGMQVERMLTKINSDKRYVFHDGSPW